MEKILALIRRLCNLPQVNITSQQAIDIAQAEFAKKSDMITRPRIGRVSLKYYYVAIHGNRKGKNTLYVIDMMDGSIYDVIRLP